MARPLADTDTRPMRIFRRPTMKPTEESRDSTDRGGPPKKTDNAAILVPNRDEFLRDLTKLGKNREAESAEPD